MFTFPLKTLRDKHNLTQEQMAQIVGVSRPTYIRLENGRTDLSLRQAEKVAKYFHISLEELSTPHAENIQFDQAKYRDLLTNCIKYGSDSDGKITKTKLAKLVYLIDFGWFYDHLTPMSGVPYRKIANGPVPDEFFRVIDELYEEGAIHIEFKGVAQMIENTESSTHGSLSSDELDFIQKVCKKWRGKNTKDIVEFTHDQLPWKITADQEIISYSLITQEEPTHVY